MGGCLDSESGGTCDGIIENANWAETKSGALLDSDGLARHTPNNQRLENNHYVVTVQVFPMQSSLTARLQ